MTLYTNMPLEIVLDGMGGEMETTVEALVHGVKMQVIPVAPGIGKIVRLLECDLHDYLNPAYTPGSIIHYQILSN